MDIRDYGAIGNGIQDDHKAIQAVLDDNDGLVTIPKGVYKIGSTLRISSNTRLQADPAAHLFFADGAGVDSQRFLITNKNHDQGDNNIHIEGGIWDGNNPANPRGPDKPGSYTGAILNIINVSDFSMRQMTFRDAEAYFTRFTEVNDFEITDIRFEANNLRPNQDGIHVAGFARNGLIRNIEGVGTSTNDDLVTLSADDALDRAQNLDLKCGPVHNIRVENLKAESCHTFVRLLSVRFPVSDVTISNVEGGCRCMALNLDGCRECRILLFDPEDPQYRNGVGDISNIRIKNFNIHKSSPTDNTPLINIRTNVQNFVIEDFHRDSQKDTNPAAPTINFSNCRASQLIFDGMTQTQIKRAQESEEVVGEIISQAAPDDGTTIFQSQYDVDQQGILKITQGGFLSLSIDPAKYNKS